MSMRALANDVVKQQLSMNRASARVREVADIAETALTHLFFRECGRVHPPMALDLNSCTVSGSAFKVLLLRELYFPDTAL